MCIKQPKGFQVKGQEGKVCRLQKAFFGLRQAPCAWYTKIDTYLQNKGLTRGGANANVYFFNEGRKIMLLILYIDDVYLTCSHIPKLD
jgi:histone deacetylase 1/2